MDDERLIDLVEANDVLYNRANLLYISVARKKEVWSQIAEELCCSEELAIRRYRELRDRFVRSKRMELIRGVQKNNPSYIVSKMNFLTPHIFNKRRNAKITWEGDIPMSTPSLERSQQAASPMYDDSDTFLEMPFSSTAKTYEITRDSNIKGDMELTAPPSSDSDNGIDSPNSTESDDDEAFCEAIHSFKKLCKSKEEPKGNDALNGFVQMIMATIEGMSANKQVKAMLRVTEVVMQIKMEEDD